MRQQHEYVLQTWAICPVSISLRAAEFGIHLIHHLGPSQNGQRQQAHKDIRESRCLESSEPTGQVSRQDHPHLDLGIVHDRSQI